MNCPSGATGLIDLAPLIHDYADTAALISQLDLVISVDTSVAHLAGALGRPVWLLLPFAPDWRWGLEQTQSPWYPTLRLLRQPAVGDWGSVVRQFLTCLDAGEANFSPRPDTSPTSAACRRAHPAAPAAPSSLFFAGPPGENHGWGVCNRHLYEELSRLTATVLIDPREARWQNSAVAGSLFTPLQDHDFTPLCTARGRPNLAYTFFENELTDKARGQAERFDRVFAGSEWCRQRMRERGIDNGRVLLQGVDQARFHPHPRASSDPRFLIFSGGKFELRKGQDLVLKALAILQQKYPDIVLVNAWCNPWPNSLKTMAASRHIRFELRQGAWPDLVRHWCQLNGLDVARVIPLPLLSQEQCAQVYQQSDLGLFPNRCEGGTNLVLMEYMACGKPVVASFTSGHRDILTENNALLLKDLKPFRVSTPSGQLLGRWEEPSVDEIIAQVEAVYHDRERGRQIGGQAARDMRACTWTQMARTLLENTP